VVRLSPSIRGVAMACQMLTEPATLAVAEAPVGAIRHTAYPVGVPGQRDADRLAGICVPTPAPFGRRPALASRSARGRPNRLQKAMQDAGIKLTSVASTLSGRIRRGKRLGGVGGAGEGPAAVEIPALRSALVGALRVENHGYW